VNLLNESVGNTKASPVQNSRLAMIGPLVISESHHVVLRRICRQPQLRCPSNARKAPAAVTAHAETSRIAIHCELVEVNG
jgi:hypothetical protein